MKTHEFTIVATGLSLDDDEWEETLDSGGEVADKLKPDERIRARNMVKESTV